MTRSLQILGEPKDRNAAEPVTVEVGGRVVSIVDAHDGSASRRFAEQLRDAGGRVIEISEPVQPDLRILVRSTPESPEAQLRAEVLEESADVILGSPRAAFARYLASAS